MRYIVNGGRHFIWFQPVFDALNYVQRLDPEIHIIEGGARGADYAAYMYCVDYEIPHDKVKAEWDTQGNQAGIWRNIRMLKEFRPDGLISFPGGRGTEHMRLIAQEANLPIWTVNLGLELYPQAKYFVDHLKK